MGMSRFASELTDTQWKQIEPCLPPLKRGRGGPKPIDNRRHFMDFALWGALERPARTLSIPKYVLAQVAVLGRERFLVKSMAKVFKTIGPKVVIKLGGSVFRRQLCFCKKKGPRSWQNKARQGFKVDSGGRRRRYSSWRHRYLGITSGGNTH